MVIFHCYVSLPEGKPPMTGNSDYIIYKNGDDWELVQMALVYPQYVFLKISSGNI
jgi:hypothetical protein